MSVLFAWVAFGSQGDQQLPERSRGNRGTSCPIQLSETVMMVLGSPQLPFKCTPRELGNVMCTRERLWLLPVLDSTENEESMKSRGPVSQQ